MMKVMKFRRELIVNTKLGSGIKVNNRNLGKRLILGRISSLVRMNYLNTTTTSQFSTWRNFLPRQLLHPYPPPPPVPPPSQPHDTLHFGQLRTDPYHHFTLENGNLGERYLKEEREYYNNKVKGEWKCEVKELEEELERVIEVAGELGGGGGDRVVEVKLGGEGKGGGSGVTIYGNEAGYYYYPPSVTTTTGRKEKFKRQRKEYLFLFKELDKLGDLDGSLKGEGDNDNWEVIKFQVTDELRYLTLQLRNPTAESGPLLLLDRRPTHPPHSNPLRYFTLGHHPCKLLFLAPSTFNSLLFQDRYLIYTVMGKKLIPESVKVIEFGNEEEKEEWERVEVREVCREEEEGESGGRFLDIGVTRDQNYITINCNTLTTSTVYLYHPDWYQPHLIHPPIEGVECFLDHLEDKFIILSNHYHCDDHHPTNPRRPHRLYTIQDHQLQPYLAPTSTDTTPFDWKDIAEEVDLKLDYRTDTLTDVELFKDYALLYGSDDQGLPFLKVHHWSTGTTTPITDGLPTVSTIQPAGITQVNPPYPDWGVMTIPTLTRFVLKSFTSHTGWILLTSPLHPPTTLPIQLDKAQLKGIPRPIEARRLASIGIPNSFHPSSSSTVVATPTSYHVTREWIPGAGPDHPAIPLTYITGHPRQPDQPILMVAYGAYGVNLTPDFRPHYFPLLRRGWAVTLVHVRGGSELGPEWYQAGVNFPRRIDDFLRAAQYLHDLTPGGRILAATGTSAGAVTVAGAVHRQPALFRALTLHAPFLDPLTAMLDPDLPLTSSELLEWSNPTLNLPSYLNLHHHSPYDTLPLTPTPHSLPPLLLTVGAKDLRIDPLVPLKYLAYYRSLAHPTTTALLNWSTEAGHRPTDRGEYYRGRVEELQFLLEVTKSTSNN